MAKGSKKLSKRVKPNKAAPQSPSRMRAKPILLAGGNPQIAKADGDAPVFGMRRRGRRTDTNPSGRRWSISTGCVRSRSTTAPNASAISQVALARASLMDKLTSGGSRG